MNTRPERIDPASINPDLALAVAVAREAGALLRDEFHRSGGPRGHGSHAEIDKPVEELIRRRLLDARRDDGFLGEETGSRDPAGGDDSGRRRWIVDPNDGTSEFLKGHRGTVGIDRTDRRGRAGAWSGSLHTRHPTTTGTSLPADAIWASFGVGAVMTS
jgi:hypothetical protein